MSFDVAAQLCAAAGDLGLTPFVRIPERDYGTIGRLLDGGAHGIIAPRVETAAEAETIGRACRFPPRGQRSQIAMVPQLGMRPTPARELNPALDEPTIVQILARDAGGRSRTPTRSPPSTAWTCSRSAPTTSPRSSACPASTAIRASARRRRRRAADACRAPRQAADARRHRRPGAVRRVALGVCPLRLTGTDTELLFSRRPRRRALRPGRGAGHGHDDAPLQTTRCARPRATRPALRAAAGQLRRALPRLRARLSRASPSRSTRSRTARSSSTCGDRVPRHRAHGARAADVLRHRQLADARRAAPASARAAAAVVRIEEDTPDDELDRCTRARRARDPARPVRAPRARRSPRSSPTCAGWPRAPRPRGWHLQFYTPGTVVRDLLPFLADLEEPFVIDHMGYMLESDGLTRARLRPPARRARAGSLLDQAVGRRTGSRRASRCPPSNRSAARWSRPGPTGCCGARTGRTCRTASATPASCSTCSRTGRRTPTRDG